MAHIDPTKSQTIYYQILINHQIIRQKSLINYQKESASVHPEIPPMKKSLIHLNINTKKPLETVDTSVSNYRLIKPVPNNQKIYIGSVTLSGLICLSAEQSPQLLEKVFSNC